MLTLAMNFLTVLLTVVFCAGAFSGNLRAQPDDAMLAKYFESETARLRDRCLEEIKTLDDWNARKGAYREQLFDMLGLHPLPAKTDLKPVVTGKVEHPEFTVEKLHFQSMPGLYVTANLYLPKNVTGSAPTILYLCGHARVFTNGVSYGNKAFYQHHGIWFARNGYACLVIDTLQLGEIEGLHHGTYREGMWWWNARGYTPAGVEAWNTIRALDYLATRPEVDNSRIGVTGRSGGGAYSWVLAALDDRVKVSVPVAGITDLENYVVDHAVEGHCDCMFVVNTYRWDYPLLAALTAPRPLLFSNSDKDRIFPLDGIIRTHAKVKKIYEMHNATNHLGLLITEGPHTDTQDLQVPAFRWFNRFLKNDDAPIEMAAKKMFAPEELKVFEALPKDQINTRIHESFVPLANAASADATAQRESWMRGLKEKVFAGWPEDDAVPELKTISKESRGGVKLTVLEFDSQEHVPLRLYIFQKAGLRKPRRVALQINELPELALRRVQGFAAFNAGKESAPCSASSEFARLREQLGEEAVVFFAPRNLPEIPERKPVHLRRRFMLLGQTLDGMRAWDIRQAIGAVNALFAENKTELVLRAEGPMAVNALYASLFASGVDALELENLPASHRDGPDYLNVLRVMDIPQAVEIARERANVSLIPASAAAPVSKR